MVHRLAAALASLAAVLLMAAAPSPVAACCGNVFHKTPIGWTTEGALLVETYDSSECESNSTAEVHTPGNFTPDSRFDLYDDGRRLRGREQGVLVNPWESDPDIAEPGDIPASLAHRFVEPVPSLCGRDIYVQAAPLLGEPADISPWDSKLEVTVSVMTDDGFTEITRDVEIIRVAGHEYTFSLLPSPDGVHAVLRVHLDNSDATGDELYWVRLPENAVPPPGTAAGCSGSAFAVPSTTVSAAPDPEESRYLLANAVRWYAEDGGTEEASLPSGLLNAVLWSEPGNTDFRGYVVEALEEAGSDEVAREVSADLPPGPRPSFADVVVEPAPPVDISPPAFATLALVPEVVLVPKVAPGAVVAEAASQPEMRCEDGGCYALAPGQYDGDAGLDLDAQPMAPASCGGAPGPAKGQPLRGAAFPALFLTLGLGAVAARRGGRL